MRKIGVLTYHSEYVNHGTNMQSYSTLKAVSRAYPGDRVELVNYAGWKPTKRPYLSQVSIRSLINDVVRIRKYDNFFKKDLVFGEESLISGNLNRSIDFINNQNYDAIYVGADTLLELKRASSNELTAYWLSNEVKCKKILIAASSNSEVYEGLTTERKKLIQATVDGYCLLGVRDEPTRKLISHFIEPADDRLHIVPDPTFTYQVDYSYVEKYLIRKKLRFNKPVVCMHLLRDSKWGPKLARQFRKAGFIVASFRPAYYADVLLTDLSAHEQAGIYKYFDLVITHRFHDSIFSIKNLTPVIFFPEHLSDVTGCGESKTLTIFKFFGLDAHNYIQSKDNITAENLYLRYPKAIEDFKVKVPVIQQKLEELSVSYNDFVKKSRLVAFGC